MSDRAPMLKPADLDVFLVAVEPSADVLGTGLMTALRATHKGSASFRGLGGAGMVQAGLATSGSAAWRAVDQGAVSIDGVRITNRHHVQRLAGPIVVRLGRKMVRVETKASG